ncbi:YcxB family protein [Plebeiibacterium sediminum]|uniref:YcxB family protein n=1 Tax=Plebeiibacterium sediminum TaxID=2992112 RepID=A0AAE3M215_9BACT|nr:YcxB family protein [Plebeiobacterium sediminum]MCW3785678.1 YcxB family protein [Plebeiobacterium sediminum]
MTIKYTLTREDYLQMQLFAASKSPRIIKSRNKSRWLLSIVYVALGIVLMINANDVFALTFILFGIGWYFYHPSMMRRRYKRHFEKYIDETLANRFDKTVELSFEEDFLMEKSPMGESKVNLSEVTAVFETNDYFYIEFSSGQYAIIPKDRIMNLPDFSNFIKEMTVKLSAPFREELDWKWK